LFSALDDEIHRVGKMRENVTGAVGWCQDYYRPGDLERAIDRVVDH
jgi:hypothetical protein